MKNRKMIRILATAVLGVMLAGSVSMVGCSAEAKGSTGENNGAEVQAETNDEAASAEESTETDLAGGSGDTAAAESGTEAFCETDEGGSGTKEADGTEANGSVLDADSETGSVKSSRPKVRGIYVTGAMAGTANMDNLIDLVDRTELNTLVIDIKNDEGRVVCDMDVPMVNEIGAVKRYVKDMPALIQKCKEKGIYLIARIVAFKDPFLAQAKPEWSLHNTDGSVFKDKDGLAWVNPYEPGVWEYLVKTAQGAVALGFDEVQFDYIRFSTDRGMKNVDFGPASLGKSKEAAITEFTAFASEALHQSGAAVSADVYGIVIDSKTDQQIVGQDYNELAKYLDALSPMIYPSHYGPYNYNIPIPDAQPYDTVLAAMQSSKKVLAGIQPETAADGKPVEADASVSGNAIPVMTAAEIAALAPLPEVRATVRPWLQDFTATWVKGHIKYGPEEIRAQIQAVYDAGYDEWILWNAANRYTEGGLFGADDERGNPESEKRNEDTAGVTGDGGM